MKKSQNYNLRFCALQAAYWAAYCSVYAFWVNILTVNGYDSVLCGVVLTAATVGSICVQFVLGYVADTYLPAKRMLLVLMGAAALVSIPMPLAMGKSAPVVVVSLVGMSLLDYSLYTSIDVWVVASMEKHPEVNFSFVRAGGSIGYAVTGAVLGAVVSRLGVNLLFWIHSALLGISMLLCLSIEEVPCLNSRRVSRGGTGGLSLPGVIKLLLGNKPYMMLILLVTLMQFSFRPTLSYLYLILRQAGGGSFHLGAALLIGSGLEALALGVGHRLVSGGMRLREILAIAMLAGTVRMFTLLIPMNVWAIIALQIFEAMAYGCYLCVFTEYISKVTPRGVSATATTIATAVTAALGTVPGNLLGGVVIRDSGLPRMILICACGFALALVLSLPGALEDRRLRKTQPAED